jgi:hypothetical protein
MSLERELDWCCRVMDARFHQYFAAENDPVAQSDVHAIAPPDLSADSSEYARVINLHEMTFDERVVLALSLMPHVRPQALDLFYSQSPTLGRAYTEFGGWRGKAHMGFLPTCETAAFILAGRDLARRFALMPLFDEGHFFRKTGMVTLEHQSSGEPFFCATLTIGAEYLNRFTTGDYHKPDYSANFPAKLITTKLSWDDLVLAPEVMDEIENLTTWLRHSKSIMAQWGLDKTVKPGYRSLFYGPPGTGKTLTATLIGASVGVDVYRIDLSMVVSKYIGETEKNLANVFDQAENKNWILFFDEADALFGKRTQGSSSNDRHANQEISYLLQRVEDFPGVVILASNLKANIDEAFSRRFQTAVYFPLPDAVQRLRLWKGLFPKDTMLAPDVNLEELAEKYELAGGALTNVIRYAAIRAMRMKRDTIMLTDLTKGIAKELLKEGRTL